MTETDSARSIFLGFLRFGALAWGLAAYRPACHRRVRGADALSRQADGAVGGRGCGVIGAALQLTGV
jgi:hypothetical protein